MDTRHEKGKKEGELKLGLENDKFLVNFVPNNIDESMLFDRLLKQDLSIRARSTLCKTLNQIQDELKECLLAEKKMEELLEQISQSSTREQEMEQIMHFVPCIMHCENRVCIKILTMILIEGLSNYQGVKFAVRGAESS